MLANAGKLYQLVKQKNLKTFMFVTPQQGLVERHCEFLGFKVKNKGTKTSTITVTKKNQMALATCQLQLSGALLQEACLAHVLNSI